MDGAGLILRNRAWQHGRSREKAVPERLVRTRFKRDTVEKTVAPSISLTNETGKTEN
jgi:hypothetical protein